MNCFQMSLPIDRIYNNKYYMNSIPGVSHPVSEGSLHWMPALVRSWKGKCITGV